jgi:uncharacterized protein (DUF58 family)
MEDVSLWSWGILLAGLLILRFVGKAAPTQKLFWLMALPMPFLFIGFFAPEWNGILGEWAQGYTFCLLGILIFDRFFLWHRWQRRSPHKQPLMMVRHFSSSPLSQNQHANLSIHLKSMWDVPLQGWAWESLPLSFHPTLTSSTGSSPQIIPIFFKLPPKAETTLTLPVIPTQRGDFQWKALWLRIQSPLSLLWIQTHVQQSFQVSVYPDLAHIQGLSLKFSKNNRMGTLPKRRQSNEGHLFQGLKSYSSGDDVKKMDWKASARLDAPIIRVFSPEVEQPILLVLDQSRAMAETVLGQTKFDWALNAALCFASVSLQRGEECGAGSFQHSDLEFYGTGKGKNQFNQLLAQLYALHPEEGVAEYEKICLTLKKILKRPTLLVIFTEVVDALASNSLIKGLQHLATQHLVMVVTLKNPEIQKIAQNIFSSPESNSESSSDYSPEKLYTQAVAQDFLDLRQQALKDLAKHPRILSIDAEPDKIEVALLQAYVENKFQKQPHAAPKR